LWAQHRQHLPPVRHAQHLGGRRLLQLQEPLQLLLLEVLQLLLLEVLVRALLVLSL
jgi:hypothetical protein